MREAKIIQQDAERFFADGSLADVLMTVELGPAGSLGVIAVDHLHPVQAHGCIEELESLVDASSVTISYPAT